MTRTADGARLRGILIAAAIVMAAAFGLSLAVGRYPIEWLFFLRITEFQELPL